MAKERELNKTKKQTHISALETLSGTPYQQ